MLEATALESRCLVLAAAAATEAAKAHLATQVEVDSKVRDDVEELRLEMQQHTEAARSERAVLHSLLSKCLPSSSDAEELLPTVEALLQPPREPLDAALKTEEAAIAGQQLKAVLRLRGGG